MRTASYVYPVSHRPGPPEVVGGVNARGWWARYRHGCTVLLTSGHADEHAAVADLAAYLTSRRRRGGA